MRPFFWHTLYFNPLSLYRERPSATTKRDWISLFQSTLPIQGETSVEERLAETEEFQSTLPIQGETGEVYPCKPDIFEFQSTLPIQGETRVIFLTILTESFQSTLPIQGETKTLIRFCRASSISIRSPYTGRDPGGAPASPSQPIFQSTLPIQGETNIFLNIIQIP